MKICLIDDKLDEYSQYTQQVDSLMSKHTKEEFCFINNFFPQCFNFGVPIKDNIEGILDKFDVIIYHHSSFEDLAEAFLEQINDSDSNCELIGFTGGIYDIFDYHPESNHILMPREDLYSILNDIIDSDDLQETIKKIS